MDTETKGNKPLRLAAMVLLTLAILALLTLTWLPALIGAHPRIK